ncbi:MAG: hypothetical protein HY769_04035 [Candidatus Stahlbacteria bacterium]|nr:hypothetical protein [Candidatus Stahlbacteria bacterium]
MSAILLLLVNFSGSIGPSYGYYSPSLDSLNTWLHEKGERELRTTAITLGASGRIDLMKIITLEATMDYYKGKSPDKKRSLFLLPIDMYLTYKHVLFPVFLHTYIGAGLGLCYTEYEDQSTKTNGWAMGPVVKTSAEFIPTPRLGIEISGGWRFIKANDLGIIDPDTESPIPVSLWGGFFKVTFERLLK